MGGLGGCQVSALQVDLSNMDQAPNGLIGCKLAVAANGGGLSGAVGVTLWFGSESGATQGVGGLWGGHSAIESLCDDH